MEEVAVLFTAGGDCSLPGAEVGKHQLSLNLQVFLTGHTGLFSD